MTADKTVSTKAEIWTDTVLKENCAVGEKISMLYHWASKPKIISLKNI